MLWGVGQVTQAIGFVCERVGVFDRHGCAGAHLQRLVVSVKGTKVVLDHMAGGTVLERVTEIVLQHRVFGWMIGQVYDPQPLLEGLDCERFPHLGATVGERHRQKRGRKIVL